MRFLIVLAAFVAVATSWTIPSETEIANHWQKFKADHGKTYANEVEEAYRMKIFKENAIKIARHNARFEAGEVTFKVGINKFADMLSHEMQKLKGFRAPVNAPVHPMHNVSEPVSEVSWWPWQKTIDWRKKGYVTPVKDQGQCGSCWAFSATGALEGAHYKKHKKLVSLSEQNLVDCSGDQGNQGCDGGWPDWAFEYIKTNGGIDTEKSYSYTGENGTCAYTKDNSAATLSSYVDIKVGSESDLKDAVRKVGPVSIAMDASDWAFNYYESGIYYVEGCKTDKDDLDHAILVVGYGGKGTKKEYWIVKNSWGTSWGVKGYFMLARNRNNACGVATQASYPKV